MRSRSKAVEAVMKTRPVALYDPDQLAMLSSVLREALSETLDLVGSGESEPDLLPVLAKSS